MIGNTPQDQNNIKQDRFDFTLFHDLLNASTTLKDVMSTPPIAMEPWRAMVQDVWAGYYKFDPEMNPEENIQSIYQANRSFIQKFMDDPATQQTRIYTALDELSAGIAAIGTAQKLNEEINNRPDLKEKFEDFYKQVQNSGPDGPGAGAIEQLQADLEAAARDVRRAIREAAEAGEKAAENLNENLKGWGLQSSDLKYMPMDQRLELANYLTSNRRMMELARMIGRLRNLARSRQKAKVKEKIDDIHSITLGSDLPHVLPAELAALNNKTLKLDFYRKYQENALLQYDLKAPQEKGQGPIIGLIDISDSMAGSPLDLSIAAALSLVDTATRQKRKAFLIFFSGDIVKEIEFNPKMKEPEKFFEVAQIGTAGGTNFEPPLSRSLELIQGVNYKNADIVFITDGYCRLTDEFIDRFNREKKRMSFRVYSVLIGFENDELKRWSDKIWAVQRLDEETAGEIFEIIY